MANGKALYDELEAPGSLKIASILTYCNLNLRLGPQEPPADAQSGAAQPQTGEGEPGTVAESVSAQDGTDATNADTNDEPAFEGQEPSRS